MSAAQIFRNFFVVLFIFAVLGCVDADTLLEKEATHPSEKDESRAERINPETLAKLTNAARLGMSHAYAPRSEFDVGAAVLTSQGEIFEGCNVESVISGLGTCAERSAIDHAILHGHYEIVAIAVTSHAERPINPCGACLQYIFEFAQVAERDVEIYMIGASGETVKTSISKMLPDGFGPRDLGLDLSRFKDEHSE